MRMPDNSERVTSAPLRAVRAIFAGVGQLLLAADKFRSESEDLDTDDQYDPFRTWDNPVTGAEPEAAAAPVTEEAAAPQAASKGSKKKPAKPRKPVSEDAAGAAAAKDGDEDPMRIRKKRSGEADPPRRFRSLDLTGNVRVLGPAELADLARDEAAGDDTSADEAAEDDVWPAVPPVPAMATATLQSPAVEPAAPVAPAVSQDGELVLANGLGTEISVWGGETSIWETAEPSPSPAQPPELPIDGYDGLSIASLRARLRSLDVGQLQVLLDHERSGAAREEFVTMLERRIVKLTAAADDAS